MKCTLFNRFSGQVAKSSWLLLTLSILSGCDGANGVRSLEFKNGQFYTITSVATGKAMSVAGKQFVPDADIVTSPWIAQDNQLWLALGESTQFGRPVSNPEKFILVPQRQRWDWKHFVQTGQVNATITSLPEDTAVLTLDNSVVNLTQSIFNGSSSQKWITEEAGDGYVLIKNWGNQQCIKNFDFRTLNILERVRKRIDTFFGVNRKKKSSPLGTLECNPIDISERWLLEPVYILKGKK